MKILEKYNLPKLIQKEIKHLITLHVYKNGICYKKNISKNKTPDAEYFSGEFNKVFMEEIIPILYKHF